MSALPPGVDLSKVPLAPNPNGNPPNFTGGPSLQPAILGTGITFMTISIAFVIVRIGTGLINTKRLHLDDCG